MKTRRYSAGPKDVGERVDKVLAFAFPDLSRSRIHSLIGEGALLVNEKPPKASMRLREGDRLRLVIPEPRASALQPEAGDLSILHEDESLLVVAKPPGVVVHPGAGASQGTLAAALLAHCGSLSQIGGVERPGIVHRLDKGTSGLMVVAKNDHTHRSLSAQFKARTVTKVYAAVALGAPRPLRGSLRSPIGRDPRHRQRMAIVDNGRTAHTDYEVIERLGAVASVLRVILHTGRTHQIRVHLASIGCPLVGDGTYGARARAARAPEPARALLAGFARPALHAQVLGFDHPASGARLTFEQPWPRDMEVLRAALRDIG